MKTYQRRYLVYRGENLVLEITDKPGPLVSRTAPPPSPGEDPLIHPFLSATAHVPEHEGELREALNRSRSLNEFLAILRALGFRVVDNTA